MKQIVQNYKSGEVKLKIPAGIKSGQTLRLKKKGLSEVNRHRKGDLLIRINIKTIDSMSSNTKKILSSLKEELGNEVEFTKIK